MNTRRIPFQFSTADPVARQRELEKRFGLQPTSPNMYIDVNNPLSMGNIAKETSSPRLQHRVPIFAEGYDQPLNSSSVDSKSQTHDRKPNVRVIPIEIEGADTMSPRHRSYSGSAGRVKDHCDNLVYQRDEMPHFKRNRFQERAEPLSQKHVEPRIFNIPIKVEGTNNKSTTAAPKPKSVDPASINKSYSKSKVKPPNKVELKSQPDENQIIKPKNDVEVLLKKIEDVLTEFKTYETGVVEFTGTSKDKQFKYLDEMLTRCMLQLDDIDTMGIEEIRLSRKSAVKMIQASIDLLESKASVESNSTKASEVQSMPVETSVLEKDIDKVQVSSVQDVLMSDKSDIPSEMKVDLNANTNKDQSEISVGIDSTDFQTNVASNIDSASLNICLENKIDDLLKTDNDSKTSEIQFVSLEQQQNSIPEIEMSEEMPAVANDVEMLDENDLTSNSIEVKESLPFNKTIEKKDVEMLNVEDLSKEFIAKVASDAVESANINSDCSQQKCNIAPVKSPSVYSNDFEMTDIQDTLDVPQCDIAEQCISEQDVKCSSTELKNQDETLNNESTNCCEEAS